MISNSGFKEKYFDLLLEDFRWRVLYRAHGNYTKSYESFKRIENAESFLRESLDGWQRLEVLDVGCGDGYHLFVFNASDQVRGRVRFQGIDLSELKIEFARRVAGVLGHENVSFRVGDAEALEFPDECFDVVLCSDVVEHLKNPEKCFAGIWRVLKSGGTAVITTPNASNRMIKWVGRFRSAAFVRKPQDGEALGDDEHISLKGLKEWVRIAGDAGFEVIAVRRGALIFGGYAYNRHPVLFAFCLLADRLLDVLPLSREWGEAVTLHLKKPQRPGERIR